jgi:hypothetical protein
MQHGFWRTRVEGTAMRISVSISLVGLTSLGVTLLAGCETATHRVGQSTNVQFGVVRNAEQVALDSAAAQGALLGGMLGMATGSRRSSAGRNAIRGAAVGGLATAATEGNRQGMAYTVELMDGSSTRIVTDQHQIQPGDCVAVERTGTTANIRRTSAGYCDPANAQAVRAVDSYARSEAVECQRAKEELSKATTNEAADLAARKMELLCDD